MTELDSLRADVLGSFATLTATLGAALPDTRRTMLQRRRDRLQSGQYLVVVCGEFRRGKSSLLNALVERRGMFPVDVDVTTSIVSTLEWAETERAVVHFAPAGDGEPAAPQEIELGEVAEFVTEQANPRNERAVAWVAMSAPIEQLRSGLVLVDTPGAGSLNAAHTASTRAFLPRADAILFVCSAVQPPGTVELDFLAAAVEQCPVVLTAVTMIDKPVSPETVVEEARARITERVTEATGIDPKDVVVVGVSSLRKRKGLAAGDAAMVAASGFPVLEGELWGGLAATCGASQLSRAVDELDAAVADVLSPLLNELAALAGDQELARIDAELQTTQAKIKELRSGGSRWRRRLADDLEAAARPIRNRLTADFEDVRDRFRADLHTDEVVGDPATLVNRASIAMTDAVNRADTALAEVVAEVAVRYTRSTTVTLTASGVHSSGGSELDLGAAPTVQHRSSGGFAEFRRTWGGAAAGGGAASAALWAVSLVFPVAGIVAIAGTVFGAIAGLFGGSRYHEELERSRRERAARQQLKDQVLHRIDAAKRQAERDHADKLRDVTRELTTALDEHLAASADSLAESVTRMQENRTRTVDQRNTRWRELQAQKQDYEGLQTVLDGLRQRVAALVRA